MSKEIGPVQYFICGGFGGICTVLVGHPLDTIKVRLQTMPIVPPGGKPLYSGTWDCFTSTTRNEGVRGLYKGMGAPLIGVAPIFALSFMAYGIGRQLYTSLTNQISKTNVDQNEVKTAYMRYFFAGAFSGVFTTIIMAPGERIKCLLQIQQGANAIKKYDGPYDCAKKLYKEGGIRSIYKGSAATLLRDIPASGLYFLTYESIQQYVTSNGQKEASFLGTICAGGSAGIANWLIGMPPDVLKSRLQTAPEGTYPNGIRDVFKKLIRTEGVTALYKGTSKQLSLRILNLTVKSVHHGKYQFLRGAIVKCEVVLRVVLICKSLTPTADNVFTVSCDFSLLQ